MIGNNEQENHVYIDGFNVKNIDTSSAEIMPNSLPGLEVYKTDITVAVVSSKTLTLSNGLDIDLDTVEYCD